ncbi:MAG: hypothetical protein HYX65_13025 [Gemmatimonadetes bacterium]|nr:hypothetical protein [Gemmatimonadota bacterium]
MTRVANHAKVLLPALALLLSLVTPAGPAGAQGSRIKEEWTMATATRDELEAKAIEAEQIAAMPQTPSQLRKDKLAVAQVIRTRLSQGDFQAGDRIVLRITGDPNVKPEDTVTVRPGSVLILPQMGEISLRGVLRAELLAHMRREIGRFVRGATVQTTPVVRLGMFGSLQRTGFFEFPADILLSEAIMKTGGPSAMADQHNVSIRRGAEETWNRQAVDIALQEGVTIEQLGLRGGDQLMMGERSQMSATLVLQYVMISFQIVNMVILLQQRR